MRCWLLIAGPSEGAGTHDHRDTVTHSLIQSRGTPDSCVMFGSRIRSSSMILVLRQIDQGNYTEDRPRVIEKINSIVHACMQNLVPPACACFEILRLVDVDQAQHGDSRGHFFAAANRQQPTVGSERRISSAQSGDVDALVSR